MSEQNVNLSKEIIKGEQHLLNIKLDRDASGIVLSLKSDVFEEHFKSISNKNPAHNAFGHKFYIPNTPPVTRTNGVSLMSEPEHGLFHSENVNLSFIRVVGLKDGVSIKIPNGVYSRERLTKWVEGFRDGAKTYYMQVIKPFSISVEITTREI